VVLVALSLVDASGAEVSRNLYWQGLDDAAMRRLDDLQPQPVRLIAQASLVGDEVVVRASLDDAGSAPALAAKLTLVDAAGARILPAYYSDNYVSLLPGETRRVEIRYPRGATRGARLNLRGWNVQPASAPVDGAP
jgi:hypothetical protein